MKRINWKNVSITLLIASNLLLINELKTIEQKTINDIYFNQIESGLYNEDEANTVRDPNTLETLLIDNHKNGRY